MNNEWNTGTPPKTERYLVSIFNVESGDHFHSTSFFLEEWSNQHPYIITGWLPLPDLPEAPKDLPRVEKITWYPFSIKPEKEGVYFIKRERDGVMIYDKVIYTGLEWPENEGAYWTKDIKM